MKKPNKLLYSHITIAKFICLTLLFSPLWGFWWFNINNDAMTVWLLPALRLYSIIIRLPVTIIYSSVCILAFVGFVIAAFIRTAVVRVPLMLIMLIGWALELSILDVNGVPSSQNLFWVLWQERAMALEAVHSYAPYVIRDLALVMILGIVLCASPARRFSVSGIFGLLPVVSGALVAGVIVYTKGGTQIFPIPFGTFSNAAIVLLSASNSASNVANPPLNFDPAQYVAINSDVKIESRVHPIFNKILMIMDESVRGDYLSLNGAVYNTTPFLKATDHLVNFGVASSGANCSIISRTMFRFGMQQSDLPNGWREGLSRPSFWQFAHRAGFKTVHIDAWYGPLALGNGFSLAEKALIDSTINIINNPSYLRDQMLVDQLLDALKDERPAFIYVEKYGVHWPYSDKYPPDFHGLPTPLEPHTDWSVDTILGLHRFDELTEREIALYPNAIAWSVDEFFRKLLPAVDLSNTLIIYTSDHGQSLLPGRFPHCGMTRTVPRGEEYVPLFAITSVPEFEQGLEKGAAHGFDQFSHFEIFPTLLLAMGYDPGWVKASYGPSLMDSPSPDRKFMAGAPDLQPMMIPVRPTSSPIERHQAPKPTADLN
jgi:glucan phosphoethanolaminetransferase (alkaline phosphatase superfamily)